MTGIHGHDNLEDAIQIACVHTIGTYHLNGVLNNRVARIFENGGKLLEIIRGGFTLSEYNRIKALQESERVEEEEIVSVISSKWKDHSFKM